MLIIGLTGSIAMGKSTAAERFAARGIAVFDADAEVHRLYEGEAAPLIEKAFPGTVRDGTVDRALLSRALVEKPDAFGLLEDLVHPLVYKAERRFIRAQHEAGAKMAVLEIPLLFETAAHERVDVTVVVSAPLEIQRQRILMRPGMSVEKMDIILAQQVDDTEKRIRADFVVDTSGKKDETAASVDSIIETLKGRDGGALKIWLGTG